MDYEGAILEGREVGESFQDEKVQYFPGTVGLCLTKEGMFESSEVSSQLL